MPDTPTPKVIAGERETLAAFLAYLRGGLLAKLDGLDAVAARHPGVPSGTNLLWLVKHVAAVEVFWLHHVWRGLSEEVIPDDELSDDDTPQSVARMYREVAATTDTILAVAPDIEQEAAVVPFGPPTVSLRWVLVHLIEETGRHAGHADILREQIDGLTGR